MRQTRRAKFLILAGAAFMVRAKLLRWGASDAEVHAPLPGDDVVPGANLSATRAITINAPADDVWPWLVQMGQGRGGLYTYDALENLVGCDLHSADEIHAEWQQMAPGDDFRLHPKAALKVASVDQGRSFVLSGGVDMGDQPPPYAFSWAFVLQDQPGVATRLVVRERYGYERWWAPLVVEPVEVISFVMSEKMLRGVRDRAERGATA